MIYVKINSIEKKSNDDSKIPRAYREMFWRTLMTQTVQCSHLEV